MHPDPIIVHQMGKVGSKTVELSLRKAYETLGIEVPIYHTHILNGFERVRGYVNKEKHRQDSASQFAALDHGESIRKLIDENPAQHWNIISLIRDPIARNVSAFFESLPEFIPDWRERYAAGTLTAHEIQALFLKSNSAYEKPDFWFESQVKAIPAFGIDVCATPFPHATGYKIYSRQAQATLLLIRLENLKECAARAMQEFLGLENFSLYNTNTTNEKDFAALYREFNDLPLPVEYVEERYNSPFYHHFYSDEELDAFIQRWTKKTELANNASYRDKHFAEMEKSVRILAGQVVEKTQALRALKDQNAALEKQNAELEAIKSSSLWKLGAFLRGIQNRVIPPDGLLIKVMRRLNNYVVLPVLRAFKKQNSESDLALLRASDLFDAAWYLTKNPDVTKRNMDPAYHYLWYGGFQGRDPGPKFSSSWYLENYQDVKKARVNPLVHYLRNGKQEGRIPRPQPTKVGG